MRRIKVTIFSIDAVGELYLFRGRNADARHVYSIAADMRPGTAIGSFE